MGKLDVTGKFLHRLSHLFGEGPIPPHDFQQVIDCYSSLPLWNQIQIWGRLICLQPILKAIEQHIPVTAERMVDLGCGYGLVSLLVASRRNQAILGIEGAASRFAIAQQASRHLRQVTFQCDDIAQMRIPSSAAILLIDVLYLFPDEIQQQILINCGHALIPNGTLLIKDNTTVPRWKYRYTHFEEGVKLALKTYGIAAQTRPNYRTPQSWHQLITQANLEIRDARFIEAIAPYPGIVYVCQKSTIDD